ncbi:MAG: hypothetical protein BGO01_13370 [Armatimonadetes bacterium 55-13]|nr:DUF3472 domain-containing protein [Armatimonadota bacterium]OJU61900.1 MAG: hypothetical protein BGO01_13370 [Armatimonadetes bacterium 55-13]
MTSLAILAVLAQSELRIPGFTAYLSPNPEAFEVSERRGVVGWNDPATHILWFGKFAQSGNVKVEVQITGGKGAGSSFRMSFAGQTKVAKSDASGSVDFGVFKLGKAGYQKFDLSALGKKGTAFGTPSALVLSGPGTAGAHFNVESRRNAASVHLGYPTPEDAKVVKFYNEVTAKEDPLHTYYCAIGFRRGYFGMQVNSPTERRIIFSIWDSGNEANDRDKVGAEDRVKLLAKGPNVVAGDFGNEGTGGHSHEVYNWKKGQTYKFLVTAKPEGTATIYSGYFFFPEKKAWQLIASFRAPKDGGYLRGFYSFDENFWGTNGYLLRKAEFGNQWMQTEDGTWTEVTKARFTHDPTGKEARKDYSAGPKGTAFFLANGGFEDNGVKYGDTFERKPTGRKPDISTLPN